MASNLAKAISKNTRFYFCSGVVFSLFSVIFGAFGAHALKTHISADMMAVFDTGIQYQMFHALALILLGLLLHAFADTDQQIKRFKQAGNLFIIGLVLFCGSLYVLAISGVKILGAITPFGGLAFILGWLILLIALTKKSEQ